MTQIIAGNWKMHHGPDAGSRFFADFRPSLEPGRARLVFFPPAVTLPAVVENAPPGVEVGVQNIHWEPSGAFTGEVSAELAKDAGATLALIGHSERRHVFGETDDEVVRKIEAANRAGLIPVVCVGELLEERQAGQLRQVLERQVGSAASALSDSPEFMVAYEPVWAIGTGETATPADATEAHRIVQAALGGLAPAPVLYGGSVKPDNAAGLLGAEGVDGVLVGGASLDPVAFGRIAEAVEGH